MDSAIRGQTIGIMSVVTIDNVPVDITNAKSIVTLIKLSPRDTDDSAIVNKSLINNGVLLSDPVNGICITIVQASLTNSFPSVNKLYYETIVKNFDDIIYRSGIYSFELVGNIIKTIP